MVRLLSGLRRLRVRSASEEALIIGQEEKSTAFLGLSKSLQIIVFEQFATEDV